MTRLSLEDNMTSKVCIIYVCEAAKRGESKNFTDLSWKVCRTKIC